MRTVWALCWRTMDHRSSSKAGAIVEDAPNLTQRNYYPKHRFKQFSNILLVVWQTPVLKKQNIVFLREPTPPLTMINWKSCVRTRHVRHAMTFVLRDTSAWTWRTGEMLSTLVLTSMMIHCWPTTTVTRATVLRYTTWSAPGPVMPNNLISTEQTLHCSRLVVKTFVKLKLQ